jgi:ABC-2 type transport system permease protein
VSAGPGAPPGGPLALWWPRWRGLRNTARLAGPAGRARLLLFAGLGLAFMLSSFLGARWLFAQFAQVEFLAELLVRRVLDLVLAFFAALLVLSNAITGFSTLFLADDLPLLAVAPVPTGRLFVARLADTWLQSSWMMLVFALPILAACGPVLGAGLPFYLTLPLALLPLTLLCSALGALLTLGLARLMPVQRTQEILLLLAVVAFLGLYLTFRAAEPERLLHPDGFGDLLALIGSLELSAEAPNPPAWALGVAFAALRGEPWAALEPAALLLTGAGGAVALAAWTARLTWRASFGKVMEGRGEAPGRGLRAHLDRAFLAARRRARPPRSLGIALRQKETRVFFRSTGQWTQLLLVVALVGVYVFNFRYFRTLQETGVLGRGGLFVAHVLLGGLVLTTVAARFLYPAVSLEGRAFWALAVAPVRAADLLRAKLRWGLGPLLLLSLGLALTADRVVALGPGLSLAVLLLSTLLALGLAGLAVGLGAAEPRFTEANAARIASGVGGVVFMLLGLLYVVVLTLLLAWPVAHLDAWMLHGAAPTPGVIARDVTLILAALVLTTFTTLGPLALGARRLVRREGMCP